MGNQKNAKRGNVKKTRIMDPLAPHKYELNRITKSPDQNCYLTTKALKVRDKKQIENAHKKAVNASRLSRLPRKSIVAPPVPPPIPEKIKTKWTKEMVQLRQSSIKYLFMERYGTLEESEWKKYGVIEYLMQRLNIPHTSKRMVVKTLRTWLSSTQEEIEDEDEDEERNSNPE